MTAAIVTIALLSIAFVLAALACAGLTQKHSEAQMAFAGSQHTVGYLQRANGSQAKRILELSLGNAKLLDIVGASVDASGAALELVAAVNEDEAAAWAAVTATEKKLASTEKKLSAAIGERDDFAMVIAKLKAA